MIMPYGPPMWPCPCVHRQPRCPCSIRQRVEEIDRHIQRLQEERSRLMGMQPYPPFGDPLWHMPLAGIPGKLTVEKVQERIR